MTYGELLNELSLLDTEELNQDVTIFDSNCEEFFPVKSLDKTTETDILDAGHLFLTVEE